MKSSVPANKSAGFFLGHGITSVMLMTFSLATASASPLDDVGQPPPTDPSAYANPPADPKAALDEIGRAHV